MNLHSVIFHDAVTLWGQTRNSVQSGEASIDAIELRPGFVRISHKDKSKRPVGVPLANIPFWVEEWPSEAPENHQAEPAKATSQSKVEAALGGKRQS